MHGLCSIVHPSGRTSLWFVVVVVVAVMAVVGGVLGGVENVLVTFVGPGLCWVKDCATFARRTCWGGGCGAGLVLLMLLIPVNPGP